MTTLSLSVRALCEDNLAIIVLVFCAVAVGGGALTYATYVEPGTETRTAVESRWSSEAGFTHEATVTRSNDIFPRGSTLQERNAYFMRITPVLSGTTTYEYEASDAGDLQVEATTYLVTRSVLEEGETTVEYWRSEEAIAQTTVESVAPGETVAVPYTVNVSETDQQIQEIEEQLGGTPGNTEIRLETEMEISGTRNGVEVDETRLYEMTIRTGPNVYTIEGDAVETNSGQQTSETVVEASYGPLRQYGGPVLLGIGLIGLLVTGIARWQDMISLSDTERRWLQYRSARNEFDSWITNGTVPAETLGDARITVESLEGLVDVAIDTNQRVIADADRDLSIVTTNDVDYVYEHPPDPTVGSEDSPDPLEPENDETVQSSTSPAQRETNGQGPEPTASDAEDDSDQATHK